MRQFSKIFTICKFSIALYSIHTVNCKKEFQEFDEFLAFIITDIYPFLYS